MRSPPPLDTVANFFISWFCVLPWILRARCPGEWVDMGNTKGTKELDKKYSAGQLQKLCMILVVLLRIANRPPFIFDSKTSVP